MNAIGKRWMGMDLFTACLICDGDGVVSPSKFPGLKASPDSRGMAPCPECEGEGYAKTGETVGDIERLKAERDKLKAALAASQEDYRRVAGELGVIGRERRQALEKLAIAERERDDARAKARDLEAEIDGLELEIASLED